MLYANGHLHSTFSDGIYTPEELVQLALKIGHKALILTDHDTSRGSYFMQKAARKAGLLSLQGCEFCTAGFGHDIHLLGIDFNPDQRDMAKLLAYTSSRETKVTEFQLNRGLKEGTLRPGVTWDDVLEAYPYNDFICNNQVFNVYVERGIYTPEEYMVFVKPFRTKKGEEELIASIGGAVPPIETIIETIYKAEGVPVIAHPHKLQDLAETLVNMGIKGFETSHDMLTDEEEIFFDRFCDERGLYKMGGSDHASTMGGYEGMIPKYDVPPEAVGSMTEENFLRIYRRELG